LARTERLHDWQEGTVPRRRKERKLGTARVLHSKQEGVPTNANLNLRIGRAALSAIRPNGSEQLLALRRLRVIGSGRSSDGGRRLICQKEVLEVHEPLEAVGCVAMSPNASNSLPPRGE
jgi:hypothetical protein